MPKSTLTDPKALNASPNPSESKPSWQDGPYGPAAEARQEAFAEAIREGTISPATLRAKVSARKS